MCIRDSTCAQLALRQQHAAVVALGVNVDLAQILAAQMGGCLLYTSDDADERSSVDLGGRRIIKKKNTGEILH